VLAQYRLAELAQRSFASLSEEPVSRLLLLGRRNTVLALFRTVQRLRQCCLAPLLLPALTGLVSASPYHTADCLLCCHWYSRQSL
jgi:hypothetical protein